MGASPGQVANGTPLPVLLHGAPSGCCPMEAFVLGTTVLYLKEDHLCHALLTVSWENISPAGRRIRTAWLCHSPFRELFQEPMPSIFPKSPHAGSLSSIGKAAIVASGSYPDFETIAFWTVCRTGAYVSLHRALERFRPTPQERKDELIHKSCRSWNQAPPDLSMAVRPLFSLQKLFRKCYLKSFARS